MSKRSDSNNHANQLNPNNSAYRSSRGLDSPTPDGGSAQPAREQLPQPPPPPPTATPAAQQKGG